MKNFSSWMITMFMVMFWVFRVIVTFQAQYGKSFGGFIAFNYTVEIILLFATILCIILFLRRNWLGGILYLGTYGLYFGGYILTNVVPSIIQNSAMNINVMQNAFVSAIGVVIAFCAFFDLLISKMRKKDPKDIKTDWFFKNEQYDRKYDDRADKNQYRNY